MINISAGVAAAAVSVVSAWMGAGYLAIAWGANASTLTTIALTLVYRPEGLPWWPSFRHAGKVFVFGMKVGTLDLVNKGADSATEMLVGKAHGLHDLGIYSRAYGTFMLFEYVFLEGIRPVVLPYLSSARRGEGDLGAIYLRIISYAAVFMMPFFVFLGITSLDVLRVLYGPQWDAAAPLVRMMSIAGGLLTVTVFFDQLLVAKGLPGKALGYQGIAQFFRLLVLVTVLSGSLVMAATAVVAGAIARAVLVFYLGYRYLDLRMARMFVQLWIPMLIAAVIGISTMALQTFVFADSSELMRLLIMGSAALILWLVLVVLLGHPLSGELVRLKERVGRRG